MDKLLTENASTKRLLMMIIGVAILAFNKKLGLDLSEEVQMEITTLITVYLLGSNYKEAALAKAEAAGAKAAENVKDVSTAEAILKGSGPQP